MAQPGPWTEGATLKVPTPDCMPAFAQMPVRTRETLRPIAAVFEGILLSEIWRHGGFIGNDQDVARLARRITRGIRTATGYSMHPALVCYGLRLCCHYHIKGAERRSRAADLEVHRGLVDAAQGTITKLEEHYGTYRLRLLLA